MCLNRYRSVDTNSAVFYPDPCPRMRGSTTDQLQKRWRGGSRIRTAHSRCISERGPLSCTIFSCSNPDGMRMHACEQIFLDIASVDFKRLVTVNSSVSSLYALWNNADHLISSLREIRWWTYFTIICQLTLKLERSGWIPEYFILTLAKNTDHPRSLREEMTCRNVITSEQD